MRFTPPIASARSSDRRRRLPPVTAPGWTLAAVAILSACSFAGCKSPADVHPEFSRLAPDTIRVPPVVNRTIHQLDAVVFGGMLQRAVIGGDSYDIPELLQGSVEEVLLLRGYSVDESSPESASEELNYRLPLPEGSPVPAFDGVLYAEILEWQSRRTTTSGLRMRYRLELFRVPTGERLFSGEFVCTGKGWDLEPEQENVARLIRGSVRRALSYLPAAKEK